MQIAISFVVGYFSHFFVVGNKDSPMQEEMIDGHNASNFTLKKLDRHSRYRFYLRGRTAPGQGLPIIREGATTLDGGLPFFLSPIYLKGNSKIKNLS